MLAFGLQFRDSVLELMDLLVRISQCVAGVLECVLGLEVALVLLCVELLGLDASIAFTCVKLVGNGGWSLVLCLLR